MSSSASGVPSPSASGINTVDLAVAVGIVLFKTGFGAAFAAARDSEGTTDDENRKQAKNGHGSVWS